MIKDRFIAFARTPSAPASSLFEVTPDDSADLPEVVTALSVETPGKVRITTRDGQTGDIYITAGLPFPIRVQRVWETGTTATGIRGLA